MSTNCSWWWEPCLNSTSIPLSNVETWEGSRRKCGNLCQEYETMKVRGLLLRSLMVGDDNNDVVDSLTEWELQLKWTYLQENHANFNILCWLKSYLIFKIIHIFSFVWENNKNLPRHPKHILIPYLRRVMSVLHYVNSRYVGFIWSLVLIGHLCLSGTYKATLEENLFITTICCKLVIATHDKKIHK